MSVRRVACRPAHETGRCRLLTLRVRPRIVRATIVEIAREAGVSTATVDRALNNRAGVRERTRDRVLSVAESLGYLPERIARDGAREGASAEIDFLIPGGTNTFLGMLADAFRGPR